MPDCHIPTLCCQVSTPRTPPLAVAHPGEQPSVAIHLSRLLSLPSVINRATATLTKTVVGPMSPRGSGNCGPVHAGETSGIPSIVSLSLGDSASTTFDNGIIAVINTGIHDIVAAGNDNRNASGTCPARVAAAITVGATIIADAVHLFQLQVKHSSPTFALS
ncbi:uncharacterized protein ARMOST_20114 [Armillaria ostoyae]|uniref:Peptidase S8/S53 domain-containing protein n=1 Tax=Armillaria ostoyae TaxID=47428 RepID=A0A284S6G3_ARMOS|nr:uncharacterized protein ARMOST_20114 [Armillaria ostoyae]